MIVCLHFSGLCNTGTLSSFMGAVNKFVLNSSVVSPVVPCFVCFSGKAFSDVQNPTTGISLFLKEVFQKGFWMS